MNAGGTGIVYRSKAHAAYEELRRRILNGELAAGASLNQEQLAAELGVSTTPLREALRSLESEGLVRGRSHKDIIVAPLDDQEIVEVYEVRRNLDGLAARLAAQNPDEAARDRIRDAVQQVRKRHADPVAANREFHRSIYLASGNDVLIEMLEALWNRSDRYRRFSRDIADTPGTVAEHEALAEAVLSGKAKTAEMMMLAHINQAANAIREAVAKQDEEAVTGSPARPGPSG
jgi:DNA-binding GntR family transcriptional regulator